MNPLLSICVPTYNRSQKLKTLLSYFFTEKVWTNNQIEVIISNNYSSDDTQKLLNSICYSNTTIFHQKENIGLIGNLLFLQKKAKGKFIWFIGDDDVIKEGTINYVISILNTHADLHHIFINFSEMSDGEIVREKMYKGSKSYFSNGFEALNRIATDSELGALMFLSANVYKRNDVDAAYSIIKENREGENLALPLGYSVFCSQYPCYIISDICIHDEIKNISWNDRSVLVWYRDMIAICDVVAMNLNKAKDLRKLLLTFMPKKYPEIIFMFYSHKFNKNNYALMMYLKDFKINLFFDIITFPFYISYKIAKKVLKL